MSKSQQAISCYLVIAKHVASASCTKFELCTAVCWLVVSVHGQKWVWGNNNGRDGLRGEHSIARPFVNTNVPTSSVPLFQSASKKQKVLQSPQSDDPDNDLRYEVYENGNGPGGPNELPSRPPIRPPTQYPGRPSINRPDQRPFPSEPRPPLPPPLPPRPTGPLGPRPPPPPPPPGQGRPDLGILTGPVPSWEGPPPFKNNDPTSFDSCKCVNSFNCKSPGLKFGSCDVGKLYCCYNNPGFGVYSDGAGAPQSFGSKGGGGPPVLAGPGGPIDRPRPDFLRPPQRPPFPEEPLYNRPPPPGLGPLPFDDIAPRSNLKGTPIGVRKV